MNNKVFSINAINERNFFYSLCHHQTCFKSACCFIEYGRISGKMSKISDTTEKDQVGSQVLCLYWTNSIRSTFLINSFIYKELDHRQLEVINVWTDKIGAHN